MNAPLPAPTHCVIDIEASGFGRSSYPIEVGYVLPDGRSRCLLIRPAAVWTHWDAAAEQVHGISRTMLQRHGKTPQVVAAQLNAELVGLVAYCDGWAHDYAWLHALFEEADLSPSFKLESVNSLLADAQLSRLDLARRTALLEMGLTRHRASNDARALQLALSRVEAMAPMPQACGNIPA